MPHELSSVRGRGDGDINDRRALKEQQDRVVAALVRAQEEKMEQRNKAMAEREV